MTQHYLIASSLDLSGGQLNRHVREALEIFKLIRTELGVSEEFTRDEAFDYFADHAYGIPEFTGMTEEKRVQKERAEKRRITRAINFLVRKRLLDESEEGLLYISGKGIESLESGQLIDRLEDDDEDPYGDSYD